MRDRSINTLFAATFGALIFSIGLFSGGVSIPEPVSAQTVPAPAPEAEFDMAAAVAKIRESIKGREQEPAEKVFKNIKTLTGVPAGRIPAIMQMGYSRSLGVDCTHCHVPEKWDAETKPQKQIARDMAAMVAQINGESLRTIKNLKSVTPTINCTTCHRGEVKPALNLPTAGGR